MFTLLLLAIITLTSSLHGMNNNQSDWELYKNLKCNNQNNLTTHPYDHNNIEKYKNVINVTDTLKDGYVTAKLIHLCFPPEVEKHITQYLSEDIATEYKHKLITHKWQKNSFKEKKTNYKDDMEWDTFIRHDGTYSVKPLSNNKYVMWNELSTHVRRYIIPINNKNYFAQLISTKDDYCNLACISTEDRELQNKEFCIYNTNRTGILNWNRPIFHYLLSNDSTLIAMEHPERHGLIIKDNTYNGSFNGIFTNGAISALCSAHHSPAFVAGSNQPYTSQLPNLILLNKKTNICLNKHNAPITCVEFSPDDTRLLSCSYDETNDRSLFCLWNTNNFESITLIKNSLCLSHIKKAFFICNGKQIVTISTNGQFLLFDGFTGKLIKQKAIASWDFDQIFPKEHIGNPIVIWSNKNNLLIMIYNYTLQIHSPKTGFHLGHFQFFNTPITGAGLTLDETTVVSLDESNRTHELELYDKQDYEEIAFIENKANIIDIYSMLEICKIKDFGRKTYLIPAMKSYIQEQLNQGNTQK